MILIVEHDVACRAELLRAARAMGMTGQAAGTVAEALTLLAAVGSGGPVAVMVGLMLVDGCGLDVLQYARAAWPGCPVAVLAGPADPTLLAAARAAGPTAILAKPVRPGDIAAFLAPLTRPAVPPASAGGRRGKADRAA